MRSLWYRSFFVVGLLLIGVGAYAQYHERYEGSDPAYWAYGRGPLDRVRADLNRAARNMHYLSVGELLPFDRARDRLAEFQHKWERGGFDRENLNEVIASLHTVIERNSLRPRDRGILMDDLARLQELRERHDRASRYRP